MNKAVLKKAAIQSLAFMILIVTLSYANSKYQIISILAYQNIDNMITDETVKLPTHSEPPYLAEAAVIKTSQPTFETNDISMAQERELPKGVTNTIGNNIVNQLGNRYLMIKKPQGKEEKLTLDDLYMSKSICLNISGLTEAIANSDVVGRINQDDAFFGDPIYKKVPNPDYIEGKDKEAFLKDFGKDFVHNISLSNEYDIASNSFSAKLLIELDNVYAHIIYEDENYFYIDLRNPKDVYDKVIVIDAGHGGKDSGAISVNGSYEKNINLNILLRLKKLLEQDNIKVYYTRQKDETVFLRPRASLANAVDCDFFISIHCNSNEVSWPNGTEVLYYDKDFKGVHTEDLAKLFLDELSKTITLTKQYIVKKSGDDIYILHNAIVPSILIEVGYLSNNSDMDYLSKDENIDNVANGIYNGIMKAYDEFYSDSRTQ